MSNQTTATTDEEARERDLDPDAIEAPALVIAFARDADRIGETLVVPEGDSILGRGDSKEDDGAPRLRPIRQRPGSNEPRPVLADRFLSRIQLRIQRTGKTISVENVGRGDLLDNSQRTTTKVQLSIGDSFAIGDRFVLLCVSRPPRMRRLRDLDAGSLPEFGEPDEGGAVGESVTAWGLRDAIAFLAGRSAHVLLLGPSGSGKEIAAQAIHRQSIRKTRALVARNAATIPTTLVEAELFGHAANYPNAGMPERPGLVGEATGSTLFLDEIGELSEALQTKLLRLLDAPGEYQRLGDSRRRVSDVRFIGATNRDVDALRADVAARLKLRLRLVGLNERRDDILLIARHVLRTIAAKDDVIATRFFDRTSNGRAEPRISCALALRLVAHDYTTHVRELEALLWTSISQSTGDTLELTEDLKASMDTSAPSTRATSEVTAEMIRAALERSGGSKEDAWRELGLANRHVLKRLIKKYGL
jgi:DNA-binding NtrC family response regulator